MAASKNDRRQASARTPAQPGDLPSAEINEKQARSIKYQLTIAKLPLAKDLENFQFGGTPINLSLINDLASGGFIAQQRNAVLVAGTGKTPGHGQKLHPIRCDPGYSQPGPWMRYHARDLPNQRPSVADARSPRLWSC